MAYVYGPGSCHSLAVLSTKARSVHWQQAAGLLLQSKLAYLEADMITVSLMTGASGLLGDGLTLGGRQFMKRLRIAESRLIRLSSILIQ